VHSARLEDVGDLWRGQRVSRSGWRAESESLTYTSLNVSCRPVQVSALSLHSECAIGGVREERSEQRVWRRKETNEEPP
jgi:hypothetical protein